MAKKNNKPTLDESEYFDEIQAQVTELMGPPPLQTTPTQENRKTQQPLVNSKENNVLEKTGSLQKPTSQDIPESTVPKPPSNLRQAEKTKSNKQVATKLKSGNQQNLEKDDDIVSDKSITIEQAEEMSNKLHKQALVDSSPQGTDSIYSTKVSSAVKDIEEREVEIDTPRLDKKDKNHKQKNKFPIKKTIIIAVIAILVTIISILAIPKSRYFLLNWFGVRSSVSLKVVDSKTSFPISGVEVRIQEKYVTTDSEGIATLSNLTLGKTNIIFKKRSFDEANKQITIGWGSNPIDTPFSLEPAGNVYNVFVQDWVSGKGIEGVSVVSADSRVTTNKSGLAEITIAEGAPNNVSVQAEEYRNETAQLLSNQKKLFISLVPATPNYYINENDGKYNLQKVDLDGKNKVTVFGGTGSENLQSMSILAQPSSKEQLAAFVSTRAGIKNPEGYLLSDLYIVEAGKKIANKVDGTQSEKIDLIGWNGSKIIFLKTVAGPSAMSSGRQRIMSYDTTSESLIELAKSDYFADIFMKNSTLYFANSGSGAKLYSVQTDGGNLRTILNKEVWALEEISETTFAANTTDKKWNKIIFGNNNIQEINGLTFELDINKLKRYSPSGAKLAILDSSNKNGALIVKKANDKNSEYKDVSLNNKGYMLWVSENYLMIKSNSLHSNAKIVNIDSSTLTDIE